MFTTDSGDAEVEKGVLLPLNAEVIIGQCRTEADVLAIARDADALIVQWAPITRSVIEKLTRCRFISRYGVGVDMIDLDAAVRRQLFLLLDDNFFSLSKTITS